MVVSVIASLALFAKPIGFPKDFVGDWRGTMEWSKPGVAEPQRVKMQIKIEKTREPDTFTYQMTYGEKGEDSRPDLLKPVDASKGHWRIDERNGIELDEFWIGDTLVGVFTVSGNTIMTKNRREGNTLVSELTTYESVLLNTTGSDTPNGPPVTTQRIKSLQRAVLRRMSK